MKKLFLENKHALLLLYMFVYFIWFFFLEARTDVSYIFMYSPVDEFIPFNEVFVIPYILWFAYIVVVVLYFLFTSKQDYYKCCAFLFIGMTICLITYTFWPNAQNLRVKEFPRNNIYTRMVKSIYAADTSTNVCPSIHVYNSIGAHIALVHCDKLKKKPFIKFASFILMISICLSTMFIKQHSFVDVEFAILLAAVMYILVYRINYVKIYSKISKHKKADTL